MVIKPPKDFVENDIDTISMLNDLYKIKKEIHDKKEICIYKILFTVIIVTTSCYLLI
jgi:hypothetical protein